MTAKDRLRGLEREIDRRVTAAARRGHLVTAREHPVRVRAVDGEPLIDADHWVGRRAELDAHVLVRPPEHVGLRATRPRPAARRDEEVRMRAWSSANPRRR